MVIGLSGKSGSGKDTITDIIQKLTIKKDFIVYKNSFAKSIKDILVFNLGVFDNYKEIEKNKNSKDYIPNFTIYGEPMTTRQALQNIGEEFKKIFGKDIWIKSLKNNIGNDYKYNSILIIITDVRFENEFDFVKNELGGKMILVTSPNSNNYEHISEKPINKEYDYIIENSGTLEELENKVKEILKKEKLV